jgi:hypothetical protein
MIAVSSQLWPKDTPLAGPAQSKGKTWCQAIIVDLASGDRLKHDASGLYSINVGKILFTPGPPDCRVQVRRRIEACGPVVMSCRQADRLISS